MIVGTVHCDPGLSVYSSSCMVLYTFLFFECLCGRKVTPLFCTIGRVCIVMYKRKKGE